MEENKEEETIKHQIDQNQSIMNDTQISIWNSREQRHKTIQDNNI